MINNTEGKKSNIRDLAFTIAAQISAALGSLVGLRLLTEALSPAEYGILALWMTAVSVISITYGGPLSNSAARFFANANAEKRVVEYYTAIMRLMLRGNIVIVGCTIIMYIITEWIIEVKGGSNFLICFALGCYIIFENKYSILDNIANAAHDRKLV